MIQTKQLLAAMTAAALTVGMTVSHTIPASAVASDSAAIQLVEDMGMGWNLGNTFDSTNTWTNPLTPNAIETGWGNTTTSETMIKSIKTTGFDTVRIPVTWYQMTDSNSYEIRTDYLKRIKEVVDYCINNDMYVILNMHHDGLSGNWLGKGGAEALTQYKNMWKQIAEYFAAYDNHLVLEGMNEVEFDYDVLLTMNQAFVDTVRATGGNNATRLLLIPGANTNLANTCSDSFQMPSDSANMLAVSIHYYDPSTFCVAPITSTWGYSATWGTDAHIRFMERNFTKMKNAFLDQGIPVILGEYGVLTKSSDKKDKDSIHKFLYEVASRSLEEDGILACLWDTSNCGDMQYFNRKTCTWFDSTVQDIYLHLDSEQQNLGDIDGDGSVTLTDATLALTAYAESAVGNPSGLTPEQEKIADINGNNEVDLNDATQILTYYAELAVGNYPHWN